MTTIAAVKKSGYVAIAADTLVSAGPMKLSAAYNASHGKILRVGDTFLGMAGWVASQQVLDSLFRFAGGAPSFGSRQDIFEVFRLVHVRLRDEYFLIPRTDPTDAYESSQMNALLVNGAGIFTVGAWRTVTEYERFWAIGSGSEYALGAMHALYEKSNDVLAIAEAAVRAAADFDAATAAPIESHVICLTPAVVEPFDLPLQV